MRFCTFCGKQIYDETVICPACGCPAQKSHKPPPPKAKLEEDDDSVSILLCLLAFFVPLFGLIYWVVKDDQKPRQATACGFAGLLSLLIVFILCDALIFV